MCLSRRMSHWAEKQKEQKWEKKKKVKNLSPTARVQTVAVCLNDRSCSRFTDTLGVIAAVLMTGVGVKSCPHREALMCCRFEVIKSPYILQSGSKPLTWAASFKSFHPLMWMRLKVSFLERYFVLTGILVRCLHYFINMPHPLPSPPSSFRSGIQTLPHNAKVHYNFANFLKDSGRHQEAIHHYTTALRSVATLNQSCL